MGYHWATEPELVDAARQALGLDLGFDTQEAAEAYLSERFLELSDAGVAEVSLWEGSQLIYGPMSLDEA
jgi:hypothetical protein